jgi:hypothetical protein
MESWTHTVLTHEGLARDTCRRLVALGATFVVETVPGGWRFMVRQPAPPPLARETRPCI